MKNNIIKLLWGFTKDEVHVMKFIDKKQIDESLYMLRDWRRWMSMTWNEVDILKKADLQIQDVIKKLPIYNK